MSAAGLLIQKSELSGSEACPKPVSLASKSTALLALVREHMCRSRLVPRLYLSYPGSAQELDP